MTTPLFLLRCTEIGISIVDLDFLTIGLVIDMWTEKANDSVKYKRLASQEDFDKLADVMGVSFFLIYFL